MLAALACGGTDPTPELQADASPVDLSTCPALVSCPHRAIPSAATCSFFIGFDGSGMYSLDEGTNIARLFAEASGLLGSRTRVRGPAPDWLWSAVVSGAELVDRVRPLQVTTPQALRLLGLHYRFDASRARRELGWEPRPFRAVLEETVAWLRGS